MAPTKWQKRVDTGDWDVITAEVNDFGGALSLIDLSSGRAIENQGPGSAHPAVLPEGDAVIEAHREKLAVAATQVEIERLRAHAARLTGERRHQ